MKKYLFALVVIFISCKKPQTPPATLPYDLVVEGGINTFTTRQVIRLTKPAYLSDGKVRPLSGALVSVCVDSTTVRFTETSKPGIYTADFARNKEYGAEYSLKIFYDGKSYEASDYLYEVLPIDESYLPLTVRRLASYAEITIPKHYFGVRDASQWLVNHQFEVWDPFKQDRAYDYSYFHIYGTPNALHKLNPAQKVWQLALNDSLEVYKFSNSESYNQYIYQLFQQTNWKGILSPVPANVKGNISGNANGFFFATDIARKVIAMKDLK